jgi:hypothetical protein
MTADEFREIALSFPETEERSHMNHPDFRVGGKIFATLGFPDLDWGMASLTPEQQQDFLQSYPTTFKPAPGKWGEAGATLMTLAATDEETAGEALTLAWRNTAPKHLVIPED